MPGLQATADFAYSFAFQPIVDVMTSSVFSYEALVRGGDRQSAAWVFDRIERHDLYRYDCEFRRRAVQLAAQMDMPAALSLNALPGALPQADVGIHSTLHAAEQAGFPISRLIFEVTETELLADPAQFAQMMQPHREAGVKFAVDDFGAGHSGLNLLAEFQPDFVKLDMQLCRGLDRHAPRQAIVRGIARVCADLGIAVIAEGIETVEEYQWLAGQGVTLLQGHLFAAGGFESMPPVRMPDRAFP
ncbi:EAL domain-containing protein [Hydrocarboniphaga sp.]|uniref:EAL domain-containing protein n=1 Tax=Hydrocarboniphaga sp. TaxID=2033016 RepID=UPI003D096A4C